MIQFLGLLDSYNVPSSSNSVTKSSGRGYRGPQRAVFFRRWDIKDEIVEFNIHIPGPHRRETGRKHPIDHSSIAQNRQIECLAIEHYELRTKFRNPVDEALDQLHFSSVADVRSDDGIACQLFAERDVISAPMQTIL